MEGLHPVVPHSLWDETAFVGLWGGEAEEGAPSVAVPVAMGQLGAIGEDDVGEVDDGDVEAVKSPLTRALIRRGGGAELDDGTDEDGFCGEGEGVVDEDGVDELGPDGLADTHGEMISGLNGERCSGGDDFGWGLAGRSEG